MTLIIASKYHDISVIEDMHRVSHPHYLSLPLLVLMSVVGLTCSTVMGGILLSSQGSMTEYILDSNNDFDHSK